MPNWCENELTVTGDPQELERFKRVVKSPASPLDFRRILPYPTEYARLDRCPVQGRDGFNRGGYEWCIRTWSTKWWVGEVVVEFYALPNGTCRLVYRFDTAWSPPIGVVQALIEWWAELDFELHYDEEGVGFVGILAGCEGEVTDDRCEQMVTYLHREA